MSIAEQFVHRLRKLSTAERQALRASAVRPHAPDVPAHDDITAAWWPIRNSHLPRDPCRVVAALYGWHPKVGGRENLAGALRRAVNWRRMEEERTEALVKELLAAPFAGLPGPLLLAVQRLARGPRADRLAAIDRRPQPLGPPRARRWRVRSNCVGEFLASNRRRRC